nr:hypothetical protein [Pseudomonas sp. BIGb0427]
MAVAGGLAAAGGVAGKLVNGELMESLISVQRADGSQRLWQPTLASYRSAMQLPDGLQPNSLGQYVLDGRHYIRLDGEMFEQRLDTATRQWRIVNPRDPAAFQPPLLHNNRGAWRHVHERPLQWSRATLLRRLGHPVEAYSDQQLSQAAWISGVSEDTLRRVHVQHEQPLSCSSTALSAYRRQTPAKQRSIALATSGSMTPSPALRRPTGRGQHLTTGIAAGP